MEQKHQERIWETEWEESLGENKVSVLFPNRSFPLGGVREDFAEKLSE